MKLTSQLEHTSDSKAFWQYFVLPGFQSEQRFSRLTPFLFLSQMKSAEFVYLVCFLSIHNFRQGFVVTTLELQVKQFPGFPSKKRYSTE